MKYKVQIKTGSVEWTDLVEVELGKKASFKTALFDSVDAANAAIEDIEDREASLERSWGDYRVVNEDTHSEIFIHS